MSLPDTTVTELATAATQAFVLNASAAVLGCSAASHPKPFGAPKPMEACSQVRRKAVDQMQGFTMLTVLQCDPDTAEQCTGRCWHELRAVLDS